MNCGVVYILGWMTVFSSEFQFSYGMYLTWNLCCWQTSINSSALLVSLMVVQLTHIDRKTFQPCFLWCLNQNSWCQIT